MTKVVGKAKPMGHMARDWNGNVVPGSRGGLRDYLTIIMIFLALIDAAWVGESDNDLMIHAVVFINNNHTIRLFSEKEIFLPHRFTQS